MILKALLNTVVPLRWFDLQIQFNGNKIACKLLIIIFEFSKKWNKSEF